MLVKTCNRHTHNSKKPTSTAKAAKLHSATLAAAALLGSELVVEVDPEAEPEPDGTESPSPVLLAMVVSVAPWRGCVLTPVLFTQFLE